VNSVVCILSVDCLFLCFLSLLYLFLVNARKKKSLCFKAKGVISNFIQKRKKVMKIHSETTSAKTQNLYPAHIQLKPVTSPNDPISEKKDPVVGKKKLPGEKERSYQNEVASISTSTLNRDGSTPSFTISNRFVSTAAENVNKNENEHLLDVKADDNVETFDKNEFIHDDDDGGGGVGDSRALYTNNNQQKNQVLFERIGVFNQERNRQNNHEFC
jgi:hypothetical protein